MALDHFVSQVHLRQFNSPALDGRKLHGIRKHDLRMFPCSSKDVCRVEEGSTNPYLSEERAIEEFLRTVEPRYNTALDMLRSGRTDSEAIYVIAGFTAYVATCSPTAIRLHSQPLEQLVDVTAELMEKRGDMSPPPDVLGASSWAELRRTGKVVIDIDGKYPQAMGIAAIMSRVAVFGNCDWDILINPVADHSPFLTSDFPANLEASADPRIMNRVVPLAPDVAVRIRPSFSNKEGEALDFRRHRYRVVKLRHDQVRKLNGLVARCAEKLVFSRDAAPWLSSFLRKHQDFRLETLNDRLPGEGGQLLLSRMRCIPFKRSNRAD